MKQCKCGSTDFFTEIKGSTATGLYCSACGKWQKWLNKDEIRAFDYSNTKKAIKTNADRIRSMSDEELAKILVEECGGFYYSSDGQHWVSKKCAIERELKWLQSEAESE